MSPTCFVGGQEGPQRAGGRGGHPSARHIACPQSVDTALAQLSAGVGGWSRMSGEPPTVLFAIFRIACMSTGFLATSASCTGRAPCIEPQGANKGRCQVPHVFRGGAGGPSTRWWGGGHPSAYPHGVPTAGGCDSCV